MMKYYRHSGKTSPQAYLYTAIAAATVIPLLSFLYAVSCLEVPYVILKWAFPIIFAVLVGSVANYCIVTKGKTRSGKTGILLGSILAIWSYFLHWVFFFVYVSAKKTASVDFTSRISAEGTDYLSQVLYLIKNPLLVFEMIQKYSAVGIWSFFGISWEGGLLVFTLIVEFIVIFLIILFISFVNYDKPFSEEDQVWFKEELIRVPNFYLPEDNFVQKLETSDYKGLIKFPSKINALDEHDALNQKLNEGYAQFQLYSHRNQHYLSASNMRRKYDDKGKINYSEENLIDKIQITPSFALEIAELKKANFEPLAEVSNYSQQNLTF